MNRVMMSPKTYNQGPNNEPDVTVEIPHEKEKEEVPPTSAPPLPIQPVEPAPQQEPTPAIDELHEEIHEHKGSRWPVIAIYVVLALLVAATVVFGARWIYQKASQNPKKAGPTGTSQGQAPSLPPTSSQKPANIPANNTAPGSGQNHAAPSTASGQLPNNGPGNIVAIFIGTALAVGGLHFIYNLRKQN